MRRLSCNCPPFSAAGTLACTRVADATEEGVAKHRISDHKSLAKKCMMNVELATQLATSAKPVGSSKEDEELKTNYSSGGKRQPWSCHTYQKGNGKMTKVRHICPPIVRPHIHGSFARTSPIPLPAQSDRSLHLTDRFSPIGRSSPIGPHRSVSVLTSPTDRPDLSPIAAPPPIRRHKSSFSLPHPPTNRTAHATAARTGSRRRTRKVDAGGSMAMDCTIATRPSRAGRRSPASDPSTASAASIQTSTRRRKRGICSSPTQHRIGRLLSPGGVPCALCMSAHSTRMHTPIAYGGTLRPMVDTGHDCVHVCT